ncbi:MAG: pilus assembly protein PilM [Gammaproteobacteria bacterium]|nr:pilus assembly protein PilM [Gammaproteobacteria bacterium]
MFTNILHKQTTSLIGIEIGSTSVSLLELERTVNSVRVVSKARLNYDSNNTPFSIIQTLKSAVAYAKPKANCAALTIPQAKIITKIISLDAALPEAALEAYCKEVVAKTVNSTTNKLCFDYKILNQEANKTELQLFIAEPAVINQYMIMCQKAGLILKFVDLNIFSLQRVIKFQPETATKHLLVMHYDGENLLLSELQQSKLCHVDESSISIDLNSPTATAHELIQRMQLFLKEANCSIEALYLSGLIIEHEEIVATISSLAPVTVKLLKPKHAENMVMTFGGALRILDDA